MVLAHPPGRVYRQVRAPIEVVEILAALLLRLVHVIEQVGVSGEAFVETCIRGIRELETFLFPQGIREASYNACAERRVEQ